MPDDARTVRSIDYRSTFPFVSIFRAFRVAIDPSKLGLALVALLLLYGVGRAMDAVWPDKHRAVPREVDLYAGVETPGTVVNLVNRQWQGQDDMAGRTADPARRLVTLQSEEFRKSHEAVRKTIELNFRNKFLQPAIRIEEAKKDAAKADAEAARRAVDVKDENLDDYISEAKAAIVEGRDKRVADLYAKRDRDTKDVPKDDKEREDRKRIEKEFIENRDAEYQRSVYEYRQVQALKGEGLFITFVDYEVNQLDGVIAGATSLNAALVYNSLYNFVAVGPVWAIKHHPVYFAIFFLAFLLIWAIFGGALARIAAVQVARDEKISVRQALLFSTSKVLSFVFAPLIPIIIIALVGLLVAAGGALGNIPGIGPVLVGGLFFFALLLGLVLTLTALGLIGGMNLMYPTIAVEGTDSFDAVSRSFSYLYARPWQLAFYTAVALVYGAICYLFVRFFVFVLFKLTHLFAGLFLWRTVPTGENQLQGMWPEPVSADQLSYNLDLFALGDGQATGAVLMAIWNYLAIALVGAFAISLYFSANTIIYYLMRKEVDATDLDDVYLEDTEDDFIDTVPAPATATTNTTVDPLLPPASDTVTGSNGPAPTT